MKITRLQGRTFIDFVEYHKGSISLKNIGYSLKGNMYIIIAASPGGGKNIYVKHWCNPEQKEYVENNFANHKNVLNYEKHRK